MKWIIVGLGNPGSEYNATRHNAGRMAAAFFAEKIGAEFSEHKKTKSHVARGAIAANDITIVLPDTFMNKSGAAVAAFVKSVKAAERLIVCYDDLDLPIGSMKLSFDRGSGGHKGLESIMRAVKTKKFVRVRIGVSPASAKGVARKPKGEEEVNAFILGKFRAPEISALKEVFKRAAHAIEAITTEGREKAMNLYN